MDVDLEGGANPCHASAFDKERANNRSVLRFLQAPLGDLLVVLGGLEAGVSRDEASDGCWLEGQVVSKILELEVQR